MECGAEVLGRKRVKLQLFARCRVLERDGCGVQRQTPYQRVLGAAMAATIAGLERGEHQAIRAAIRGINGQRHPGGFEVDTDLMPDCRARPAFQQREADEAVRASPLRDGRPSVAFVDVGQATAAAFSDASVDHAGWLEYGTADNGELAYVERAVGQLTLQATGQFRGAAQKQQAAGIEIDGINTVQRFVRVRNDTIGDELFDDTRLILEAALNRHAGGLVYKDKGIIVVDDFGDRCAVAFVS